MSLSGLGRHPVYSHRLKCPAYWSNGMAHTFFSFLPSGPGAPSFIPLRDLATPSDVMGATSSHLGGPTGSGLLSSGTEGCSNILLQNSSCSARGSWAGGSCQASEMTFCAQRDLFLPYSRCTQAYCARHLTLGRSETPYRAWRGGTDWRLSRGGSQRQYSSSSVSPTLSSGWPGLMLSNIKSPKSM